MTVFQRHAFIAYVMKTPPGFIVMDIELVAGKPQSTPGVLQDTLLNYF
jgi:hypothetical protein